MFLGPSTRARICSISMNARKTGYRPFSMLTSWCFKYVYRVGSVKMLYQIGGGGRILLSNLFLNICIFFKKNCIHVGWINPTFRDFILWIKKYLFLFHIKVFLFNTSDFYKDFERWFLKKEIQRSDCILKIQRNYLCCLFGWLLDYLSANIWSLFK